MIPRQLLSYPEQLAKRLSDMERDMDKLKREMKYVNNSSSSGSSPSVEIGDGVLTIQKDGSTIGAFTANQSTNTTVDVSASPLSFYPVGSIYMSVNNTNPGTLFGGTWEQIQDRFLLAAGNTYTGGSTGGSASVNLSHSHVVNAHHHSLPANTGNHTLTVDEMPSHFHDVNTCYYQIGQNTSNAKIASTTYNSYWNNNPNDGQRSIQNTGGSQAHSHPIGGNTGDDTPGTNSQLSSNQSILPPYLTVYVWKRTA